MTPSTNNRGFTILELLIVVFIIALLATISFPVYAGLKDKMRDGACMANLKIIHVGFNNYLQENEMIWPQMPLGHGQGENEEVYWGWWRKKMAPYGIDPKNWICLSDERSAPALEDLSQDFIGSYVPTHFDELPNTAFFWRQPWIIERGENHGEGKGPNMVLPGGEIIKGASFMK